MLGEGGGGLALGRVWPKGARCNHGAWPALHLATFWEGGSLAHLHPTHKPTMYTCQHSENQIGFTIGSRVREFSPMAGDKKGQPSRDGQIAFTFWTEPELRQRVKRLSVDTGISVQALMEEAVQDLIGKYGKKERKN